MYNNEKERYHSYGCYTGSSSFGCLGHKNVYVDGEKLCEYPLSQDTTEKIELGNGSYNILTISEGYADVTEASCPDQICVHHNHIRYLGETIVCLPNKLVVEIEGGESNGIDGSTY